MTDTLTELEAAQARIVQLTATVASRDAELDNARHVALVNETALELRFDEAAATNRKLARRAETAEAARATAFTRLAELEAALRQAQRDVQHYADRFARADSLHQHTLVVAEELLGRIAELESELAASELVVSERRRWWRRAA